MAELKEITRLLTSGVPDNIQRLVDETHPADVLEAVQEEAGGDYKYLLALPDDFLADVIVPRKIQKKILHSFNSALFKKGAAFIANAL